MSDYDAKPVEAQGVDEKLNEEIQKFYAPLKYPSPAMDEEASEEEIIRALADTEAMTSHDAMETLRTHFAIVRRRTPGQSLEKEYGHGK